MNISFPEHISGSTCPIVVKILHTTLPVGPVVPFRVYDLSPTFGSVGPYNDLFRRFDTHFVSRVDLENYWADYSHIGNMTGFGPVVFEICNIFANVYMISKVPSCVFSGFCTLT